MSRAKRLARWVGCAWVGVFAVSAAVAQIAVSPSGQASYAVAIGVPPGISGQAPNLSLSYADGGINGPVGVGWSVQGISTITRCPASRAVDGVPRAVDFSAADKLCLDGQRLIQTNADGQPSTTQVDDAKGVTSGFREYRTEKDTYARIRAYGKSQDNEAYGPSSFKVWTKSGQIYEYGTNPGGVASNAQITASIRVTTSQTPLTPVTVWAVSRISDVVGNYIDFKYSKRNDVAWGSGTTAAGDLGSEWSLEEVQYTGWGANQVPYNKVVFNYVDRPTDAVPGYDRAEAYQLSQKNVSTRLLSSVRTYVNSPNPQTLGPASGAVAVRVLKLDYERSPLTGKSRVSKITECAGSAETKCLPATRFTYVDGSAPSFVRNTVFGDSTSGLRNVRLLDPQGAYGALTGDFDGDGRTDVLRWSTVANQSQLWRSAGNGDFTQYTNFNLANESFFTTDGCYAAIVADFNGDGLSDILRTAKSTCTGKTSVLYRSNGDGSFTAITLPSSIDFSQIKASFTYGWATCQDNQRAATSNSNVDQVQTDNYGPKLTSRRSAISGTDIADDPSGRCRTTQREAGKNYYVLDVNGDGILDIVTTIALRYPYSQTPPDEGLLCANIVCSRVFIGKADGGFDELPNTNIKNASLYSDPPAASKNNPYWKIPNQADINGDGQQDILAAYTGRWRSVGNGDFRGGDGQGGSDTSQLCGAPIDFNGDGRTDCLRPDANAALQSLTVSYGANSSGNLAQFNRKATGDNFYAADGNGRQNVGLVIDDFDGDGRQDILRWGSTPSDNGIYLSNGDGSFRARVPAGLGAIARPLQSADGSTSFLMGDFLGTGSLQILHIKNEPPASGGTEDNTNQLYQRYAYAGPVDVLSSVLSSSGLLSSVAPRVSIVNSSRYVSERNKPEAAQSPLVDLQVPMYVIPTVSQQTDAGDLTTEYQYQGLKAERGGRGLLGFRLLRQQSPAPNNETLTVVSEFLLQHPYDGVVARTLTYRGDLWGAFEYGYGTVLSTTTNLYCDTTSTTAPDSAGLTTPCFASSSQVKRPYLRKSTEEGRDLSGTVLPTVTTTNTYNNYGDPTQIDVTTKGIFAGAERSYTKTTTNTFCEPGASGCPNSITDNNWILGRLTRSSVTNTVPNLMSALTAGAGSSATATAVQGSPPAGTVLPINPAVLAAILQLLLED